MSSSLMAAFLGAIAHRKRESVLVPYIKTVDLASDAQAKALVDLECATRELLNVVKARQIEDDKR